MSTRRKFNVCALAVFSAALFMNVAQADIVAVAGDISEIGPPPSIQLNDLESGAAGFIFQERSAYQLQFNTRVSIPGAVGVYDENADMNPMDLLAGSTVNSYLLHFDTDFGSPRFQGTVEFSRQIVGVMLLPFALDNSDFELGAPGSLYPTGASSRRGLDFDDFTPLDRFEVLDDRTIAFDFTTSNAVDQIRVVTTATAVPEPGAMSVILILSFGILHRMKTRQNRSASA